MTTDQKLELLRSRLDALIKDRESLVNECRLEDDSSPYEVDYHSHVLTGLNIARQELLLLLENTKEP